MIILPYNEWKISRSIISHSFSTANLRRIAYIFENSIDSLIHKIESRPKTEQLCLEKFFDSFTIEVLIKSFFGINIKSDEKLEQLLLDKISGLLKPDFTVTEIMSLLCPGISKIVENRFNDENTIGFLIKLMKSFIEERKRSEYQTNDLLQNLLNVQLDENKNVIQKCKSIIV